MVTVSADYIHMGIIIVIGKLFLSEFLTEIPCLKRFPAKILVEYQTPNSADINAIIRDIIIFSETNLPQKSFHLPYTCRIFNNNSMRTVLLFWHIKLFHICLLLYCEPENCKNIVNFQTFFLLAKVIDIKTGFPDKILNPVLWPSPTCTLFYKRPTSLPYKFPDSLLSH